MEGVRSDPLFVAVTRPLMLAGVPYAYAVGNALLVAELFLIFRSWLVVLVGLVVHLCGWMLCLREPRLVDLWLTRIRHCPRVPNYRVWGCNSYRA